MGENDGIYEDLPIESVEDDLLGRGEMAENLARSIAASRPKHTSIIAITGEWGSGKTSFLNLVREKLQTVQPLPPIRKVIFSPAYFRDEEDLILLLSKELEPSRKGLHSFWLRAIDGVRFNTLPIGIASFLFLVITTVVLTFIASAGDHTPALTSMAIGLFGATLSFLTLMGSTSLPKLHVNEQIRANERKLREHKHKPAHGQHSNPPTVVFIDEIDRWDDESIRQLFKFIKINTVLTNTLFVLSYDRRVVERALSQEGTPGREYLEKFLQLEVPLPAIEGAQLQSLIRNRIHKLVAQLDIDSIYDENRLTELISKVLAREIRTLRSLNRYCSTVSFTYPPMRGEVDILDFMAMMLLRFLYPDAYDGLRNYKHELTQRDRSIRLGDGFFAKVHQWAQGSEENKNSILRILCFSFPILRTYNDGKTTSEFRHQGVNGQPLVTSKAFFERYFVFSLAPLEIGDNTVRTFSTSRNKYEFLLEMFKKHAQGPSEDSKLDDIKHVARFLNRFGYIGLDRASNPLESVLALHRYIHDKWGCPKYVDGFDYSMRQLVTIDSEDAHSVTDLIHILVVRTSVSPWDPVEDWSRYMAEIVEKTPCLSVAAKILNTVDAVGNYWERFDVPNSALEPIFEALNARLLSSARSGELWASCSLSYILEYWLLRPMKPGAPQNIDAIKIVERHVEDDLDFVRLWEQCRFSEKSYYMFSRNNVSFERLHTFFSPNLLESIFGGSPTVVDRLHSIKASGDVDLASRASSIIRDFESSEFPSIPTAQP